MGVLRSRPGSAMAKRAVFEPREGTFEAHLPKSWTVTSAETGSHSAIRPARPRPQSAHAKLMANVHIREGRLTSETVGLHTGVNPLVRQRPASDATVQLRNPAIRDGFVSSEPIGMHTGVAPRKTRDPRTRTSLPQTRTGRPRSAAIWMTTLRTSDAIGAHPKPEPLDMSDAAAVHFEAQFSHCFGDNSGHLGAVLSSGAVTQAAAESQKQWVARAQEFAAQKTTSVDMQSGKTRREDGVMMERMSFDAVYSNKHTHKDTEGALGVGLVPVLDPRRDKYTRPKGMAYGRRHQIQTAYGMRQPLPTRSTMGIGSGAGRALDF